jgi:hypothetical protein
VLQTSSSQNTMGHTNGHLEIFHLIRKLAIQVCSYEEAKCVMLFQGRQLLSIFLKISHDLTKIKILKEFFSKEIFMENFTKEQHQILLHK